MFEDRISPQPSLNSALSPSRSISFGSVAQAGLSEQFVADDLTVVGSLAGGGDLGPVDLVYVPEPSTGVLLLMGLAGLIVRSQRRRPE